MIVAMPLRVKRKARCNDDREPKKATKCRTAFECEEVMVQRRGRQSP